MNRQEAEEKITRWKEERIKVFCPLIRDMCRLDCECLNRMKIDDTSESVFTYGGGCIAYALVGGDR